MPQPGTVYVAARRRRAGRRAGRCRAAPSRGAAEPEGHVVKSPMVGTFYRALGARRQALRRSRPGGQGGRDRVHHRGDEAPERDRSRPGRRDQGDPRRERPAGRVRPAAFRPRPESRSVRKNPDRQPRRDRAAHPARVPRAGHQDRRRAFRSRRRSQIREARRRIGVHRSGRRRARAISTFRRSSARPK